MLGLKSIFSRPNLVEQTFSFDINPMKQPVAQSRFFSFVCVLLVVGFFTPAQAAGDTSQAKPNIIFILADDLGFNQIGCYGDTPIKTPNIDRLAKNGIRFTQAYSAIRFVRLREFRCLRDETVG